jgi:hypothetical protein
MKTFVSLVIEHPKPVDDLAEKIAQRAYVLTGVENVEVVSEFPALAIPTVQHTNGHAQ